ncbi:MAG: ribonuclease E inhibitor RraB [Ruminococcaceae bacterium]|nr:ribonuclease E inhibitor RraB [Oscillospiraceae bacterium]
MRFLKSFIDGGYGGAGEIEQDFCEYSDVFGKQPVLISCDLNFNDTLPNKAYPCCVKVQMDVLIKEGLPTLVAESEHSYISAVCAALSKHIGGIFVGQGIIGSSATAFLMFYIPERMAGVSKKMLNEVFMGSFRRVETSVTMDPEGLQYKKYLYPNAVQFKKSENTKLLRQLKMYGDDGNLPRPIKFNLIFSTKNEALEFYSESMTKQFVFVDLIPEPAPEGMVLPRFRLIITRTLPFNVELLERVDKYLLDLCEKYNAEYRSLETDILE